MFNKRRARMADFESEIEQDPAPSTPDDELETYKRAFGKIEDICRRAASGDLEARIVEIEDFSEVRPVLEAINKLLDLTDAFVRESGASLHSASEGKYYRQFLTRGMLGDFGRGAGEINAARQAMERMETETAALRIRLADDFQSTVEKVVKEVATAAEGLASSSETMAETAEAAHQQCIAVANASEQANESTNVVAAGSHQLSASISEISRQVNDSMGATQRVIDEVDRTTETVQELTGAATRIDSVVDFIREIAGQTNLLALNATIEAARAGDAGKGFAVVAHEVKSLAKQSADATQDIETQIRAIKDGSGLTSDAVGSIAGEAARVSEVATAIASAIEEQTAATTEISESAQRAAASIQEVTTSISSIKDASGHTGTVAKDVQRAAEELSQHSATLDNEVAQFLHQLRAS